MFNDNESTESKFMTKQEINAQEQMSIINYVKNK